MANQFISNGTCYYSRGQRADARHIPCGNAAIRQASCCQRGDLCLDHGACYNNEHGTTYLLGCTDPNYADPACPDKGSLASSPWTGLVYCNGTSNEWFACSQRANPTTIAKGDACFCPVTSRTVAFSAGSQISYVGSLPTQTGQTIVWQPGYFPDPASTTDSGTSVPTSPPTSTVPTALPPTSPPANPSNEPVQSPPPAGLTTAQQAGIGVSVSIVGLGLIAAVVFFLMRRRRNQIAAASELEDSRPHKGGDLGGSSPGMSTIPTMPDTPATVISEADGRAARPWSMRSELESSSTPLSMAEIQESAMHSKTSTPTPSSAYHTPPPTHSNRPGALSPVHELPA